MPNHHLTRDERVAISNLRHQGLGPTAISRRIARSVSTVSRELLRNADASGGYHYETAQRIARERRASASARCWADSKPLVAEVRRGLKQKWSPEQIALRLRKAHPNDPSMWLSHESIYTWAYREHLAGRSLADRFRRRRTRRRSRSVGERKGKRGQIPGRVGIEKRPAAVEDRRRFGDWEADTVEGAKGTGLLLTLVERKSRFVLIAKIADKRAETVSAATIELMKDLPSMLRRTMTADNGKEFADFTSSDTALEMRTFFANPHSPWERGANENMNGLIRGWVPKGSSFRKVGKAMVDRIQRMLNNRPRKCLDARSPLEVLNRLPGVALQI